MLGVSAVAISAQGGLGKKFGARDPRTCASKKEPASGAPTAAQLKAYFICDSEMMTRSGMVGDLLYLVTDVVVEVGKGRPFNQATDSNTSIDPSQPVYPIRGSYVGWQCGVVGQPNSAAGKNCARNDASKVAGVCYKDTFGDWHCGMCCALGSNQRAGYPPPTGN
jgi:hypothetical protein